MGTLSKLCNFVRAHCGQTVEVFVLPCYHSPPPSLRLLHHWSSISEQNPTTAPPTSLFSRATLELKAKRPDNKAPIAQGEISMSVALTHTCVENAKHLQTYNCVAFCTHVCFFPYLCVKIQTCVENSTQV